MIQTAIIIALTYYFIYTVDFLFGWQTLSRPIVAAPIAGLLLGDLQTGVIMGASLEAIYMGISAIGGSIPADALSSSILSVAFVILSGTSMEAALALALPIGTAMAAVGALMTPIHALAAPYFEKVAASGNTRKYGIMHVGYVFTMMALPATIIMFFAVAFGIDKVQGLLAALPPFVMRGLGAAGGMLPAVGFGILTSMIWSKELGAFFVLGFILSKYMALPTLAIALIGGIIALLIFFRDKQLATLPASTLSNNEEEDFFA